MLILLLFLRIQIWTEIFPWNYKVILWWWTAAVVTLNNITYQWAMNLHGERFFDPSTTQIGWSHIGPEKRECECKVLLFLLAFLEWHNWHQVWVHVTFKNRTCENYMSWEFTFIACMYGSSSSRPAMLPAFSATTQFSTAKGQS